MDSELSDIYLNNLTSPDVLKGSLLPTYPNCDAKGIANFLYIERDNVVVASIAYIDRTDSENPVDKSVIYCFDLEGIPDDLTEFDGKQIKQLPEIWHLLPPCPDDNRLFYSNGRLFMRDANTLYHLSLEAAIAKGTRQNLDVWLKIDVGEGFRGPIFHDEYLYVYLPDGTISKYRTLTGDLDQRRQSRRADTSQFAEAVFRDKLIMLDGWDVVAVDLDTLAEVWRVPVEDGALSAAAHQKDLPRGWFPAGTAGPGALVVSGEQILVELDIPHVGAALDTLGHALGKDDDTRAGMCGTLYNAFAIHETGSGAKGQVLYHIERDSTLSTSELGTIYPDAGSFSSYDSPPGGRGGRPTGYTASGPGPYAQQYHKIQFDRSPIEISTDVSCLAYVAAARRHYKQFAFKKTTEETPAGHDVVQFIGLKTLGDGQFDLTAKVASSSRQFSHGWHLEDIYCQVQAGRMGPFHSMAHYIRYIGSQGTYVEELRGGYYWGNLEIDQFAFGRDDQIIISGALPGGGWQTSDTNPYWLLVAQQ